MAADIKALGMVFMLRETLVISTVMWPGRKVMLSDCNRIKETESRSLI